MVKSSQKLTSLASLLAALLTAVPAAAASAAKPARSVVDESFTSVSSLPNGDPVVGYFVRGMTDEGPTYRGGLARVATAAQGPALSPWGARFEGEQPIAIVPATLGGRKGLLVVLEWMVEGPMAPRFAFVTETQETDFDRVEECAELQAIRPGDGVSSLTLECRKKEDAKKSVTVPFRRKGLSVSLPEAVKIPMNAARVAGRFQLELVNPEKGMPPAPGSFAELVIRSADGKSTRRIAAKNLPAR